MIPKLRRKFIAINMALVSLVLVAVFSFICINQCNLARNETRRTLDQMMDMGVGFVLSRPVISRVEKDDTSRTLVTFGKHGDQVSDFRYGSSGVGDNLSATELLPDDTLTVVTETAASHNLHTTVAAFWTIADTNGRVVYSMCDGVTISDEDMHLAVAQALENDTASGRLDDFALRFRREDTSNGTKVAFADTANEVRGMRNAIVTCIAGLLVSLAAFFVVSVYLSRWVIKPVENAWDGQRRFIADASHELKTPLTVIMANTAMLEKGCGDTDNHPRKWIDSTRIEAGRMKKLIEDMLYLVDADSDLPAAPSEDFSLSDTVWNVSLSFEPVAFENGVDISADIDADITHHGDRRSIEKLLVILTDNAVKYAGVNGRVELQLAKEGGTAVFTVKNTGEPIPESDLPHIFERFFRSDPARTEGGYGLGLSICSRIADTCRIRLNVTSDHQNGTVFTAIF